jgi:hypothetical protein
MHDHNDNLKIKGVYSTVTCTGRSQTSCDRWGQVCSSVAFDDSYTPVAAVCSGEDPATLLLDSHSPACGLFSRVETHH